MAKQMSWSVSSLSTMDSMSPKSPVSHSTWDDLPAKEPDSSSRVTGIEALKNVIEMEEVEKHKGKTDCWIVYHDMVLDVTDYLSKHPGGKRSILVFGGKDCTEDYDKIHPHVKIEEHCPETIIGMLPKKGWSMTTKLAVGVGLAAAAVVVMKMVKAK
jgi:cytochrome b involved in lipid metabolism